MNITDITIPTRFRSNYIKIEELALSIAKHGIFNPIILTQNGDLNQGGRRVSALRLIYEIGQGNAEEFNIGKDFEEEILAEAPKQLLEGSLRKDIHYRIMNIEDRHTELILELEENLLREDITWQDRAKLIKAIHGECQAEHGESSKSGAGWNMTQTAKKLGLSSASVCHDIKIADAIDESNEDVVNSKDRASALRAIIKKAEDRVNFEIRKREEASLESLDLDKQLFKLDAIDCIKALPDGCFKHVITDPPYAIEFDKMTANKAESEHYEEMTISDYIPYMTQLSKVLYEKMHSGYFVCFCAPMHYQSLADAIASVGFVVSRHPLIWTKSGGPMKNNHPDRQLTEHAEFAVVSWKGLPTLNIPGKSNLFDYKSHISITERFHITQKPIELLEDIVDTFTRPGESILDCFAGSGSTLKACAKLKRNFYGNDKSEYFDEMKHSVGKYIQGLE